MNIENNVLGVLSVNIWKTIREMRMEIRKARKMHLYSTRAIALRHVGPFVLRLYEEKQLERRLRLVTRRQHLLRCGRPLYEYRLTPRAFVQGRSPVSDAPREGARILVLPVKTRLRVINGRK